MQWPRFRKPIFRVAVCIAAVLAVTAILYAVPLSRRALTAALTFLFVVLIVSAIWGFRYSLFTSLLAALGFSWLLPPVGRLWLSDPRDVYVLVAFLVIGITTSRLSDRAHREALNANQRRAEAVAAQQRFADLVNSVDSIVWEADAQTLAFSFVSQQAEHILGYPVEQWLREPTFWKDHLYSEDRDWAVELCANATAERRSHDFEHRMIAADGRTVWLRDLVTVVVENGRATQLRGVMIDITKRKQDEETLREQANLLRLTHDAIFVRDTSATIKYWNRAAEEMYGWTAQEASGKVSHLLLKTVFPVALEQIEAELMRAGRWEGELVHTKKDGTPVVVASRWSLQENNQGAPIAILEINNDISEQKRAEQARREMEEQWRAAFDSNPTMYFVLGEAGAIVSVNAFGAEQLGYTVSELVGQPVLNVFYEPDRQTIQRNANACFERPGRTMRWEARKIRKDGSMLWVRETANAVVLKNRPVLLVVCEDITEQKRAEESLRRSEAYLAESQKLTKTGSWAYSHATERAIYWSEETFRIFGLDPQRSSPPHYDEFIRQVHPEDRNRFRENTARVFREKVDFAQDYRLMLPDGTVKHIHEIGHPVLDETAKLVEYLGTLIDVTDRKRAEETLRRSEAYLAEAQRLTKTGSWAFSPGMRKAVYWSEEAFRIFGTDSKEGPPASEAFLERVHPEDRDSVQEVWRRAADEKREYEHEHRFVLPDGTVKHVRAIGHPVLDTAGEVVEFVGTTVDVTERKRAEEELRAAETRFRTSVDHLTDALFIHDDQDDQGRIIDVNQQACDSLGYTREELIGMTAFDYDPLVDATFMRSIKERLARGETFSFETVHRRKDGTTFPVELRARPFWHGDHRFGLGLARDITDRKRAEQERERLRQLEADLAHINRVSMMGEFAASLAHEIKQPIAAAATNASTCLRWLHRQPPEIEEARETAARIAKDVNRAAEIINRVRSLYTKGGQQRELVRVNEVVEEMIILLRSEASRFSILIRSDLAKDLPEVMTDRVQLQQVFMNLMLNAIEAMKDIGGELTITSEQTDDRQLRISISDTGVGLPGEKIEHIFDAFFTTKPQGTGMGLTITRSIIEAHGGRLWASANTGRGATFHFTLPCGVSASSTSAG